MRRTPDGWGNLHTRTDYRGYEVFRQPPRGYVGRHRAPTGLRAWLGLR